MNWQPIETAAKKYGLRVLLFSRGGIYIGMWEPYQAAWLADNTNHVLLPTHWAPLTPPESEAK